MAERGGAGGERGGFGRGFGGGRPRGDRGRGGRRRGRREEEEKWVPVTKLGRLVHSDKIRSLEQIYLHSLPIKEHQIVDKLCPGLKDEVMKIMPVQKQTRAGQRTRFKAFVVVGDNNGHVGLGVKCSKEVATAIRGAIILAKLSVIPVRRGYWGNKIGSEYGMGNSEYDLPTRDKQLPVSVKKTVLRDLQNDNRIMVPNSIGNSTLLKDKSPVSDATKASGAKRASPEHAVSPPHPHSQSSNGHLVYVRRKSEAELGKSSTCDSTSVTTDCPQSRQLGHQDETTQPSSQVKEPKDSCFPAFAPFPMETSISSSGKPSVPLLLGKPGIRPAPAESNYHPIASAGPLLSNPKGSKNLQWEDRFHILQMLLRKFDEADQENYLQSLRMLSAESLSRHAVDLEKRSIQLSLEEAKELQRVAALNVLGKSMKNFKAPSTFQDRLEK